MDPIDFAQDRRLVERARDGDPAAAEALVARHQERVYRQAYRLTGEVEAARDLTQDVFLRVLQNLRRIDDGQALTRWLTRTTMNLARDRWRARREVVVFDEAAHTGAAPGSRPHAASDAAADGEAAQRIQLALMDLPHRYREAFVLRHVEELSHEDMCEALGIGLSAVKVRIHRACRMLRELLPEYDGEAFR